MSAIEKHAPVVRFPAKHTVRIIEPAQARVLALDPDALAEFLAAWDDD